MARSVRSRRVALAVNLGAFGVASAAFFAVRFCFRTALVALPETPFAAAAACLAFSLVKTFAAAGQAWKERGGSDAVPRGGARRAEIERGVSQ